VTGNLLMAKDLIVTWGIGFSDGSSSLPIENAPPGIETMSGANCAGIGVVTGADAALSLVLSLARSCGACAEAVFAERSVARWLPRSPLISPKETRADGS
jgi:hypothetical protein